MTMKLAMQSRERIRTIIAGQPADRCGFWLGKPHKDSWTNYHAYFGTHSEEEVRQKLSDDIRWIQAGYFNHPDGRSPFGIKKKASHGDEGPLAHCESLAEVEAFDWPDLKYLDFTEPLAQLRNTGNYYRMSGFWTPFFHDVIDLFGMENYLVYMFERPEIVHAVTDHVCQYYYRANEQFFQAAGDQMDGFFFGNDFGTQLSLICGPTQFREFLLPWIRRFAGLGHQYGYQVILHSCGSIHMVIKDLLEAGVDCLHPLQAKAKDMDAESLARDFKSKVAFMGGIDTQDLLVNGKPGDITSEVHRVKNLLGPRLIIGPSHEALLPNVPPENVEAMARAPR